MNTNKKSGKGSFWLVLLGLLLVIGFVSGGVYLLDDQGLISLGGEMDGERPSPEDMDMTLADGTTMQPPTRDHDESGGISSQSLLGILKMVAQLGVVVVVVTGIQWVYARLVNRLGRAPAV
ncbi:MAG: hypothetical protein KC445_08245 [Anaerolineales bacterium]|nr:hypothetical protein [Anaerolineales bacterium]